LRNKKHENGEFQSKILRAQLFDVLLSPQHLGHHSVDHHGRCKIQQKYRVHRGHWVGGGVPFDERDRGGSRRELIQESDQLLDRCWTLLRNSGALVLLNKKILLQQVIIEGTYKIYGFEYKI
jgi:hypothetical protein